MSDTIHSQLKSLRGDGKPIDRRGFLKTSLGAGFALAVRPVSAQAITTPADGLVAGEVKVPTRDGAMPAYRAMPATGTAFPTILVVQEIFGVHEWVKDIVRRIAKLGYYAIAPDLYARLGDATTEPDIDTLIRKYVSQTPTAQVMADLDRTVAYARSTRTADTTRLGITGFCWGGGMTWAYAAHNPRLKAAVVWYGEVAEGNAPSDKAPLQMVSSIRAPVLGLYGADDAGIPVEGLDRMRAAMQAAGKKVDIVVYPDTAHGFNADYRPTYRKAAAEDGWRRMTAWFRQNLG